MTAVDERRHLFARTSVGRPAEEHWERLTALPHVDENTPLFFVWEESPSPLAPTDSRSRILDLLQRSRRLVETDRDEASRGNPHKM